VASEISLHSRPITVRLRPLSEARPSPAVLVAPDDPSSELRQFLPDLPIAPIVPPAPGTMRIAGAHHAAEPSLSSTHKTPVANNLWHHDRQLKFLHTGRRSQCGPS